MFKFREFTPEELEAVREEVARQLLDDPERMKKIIERLRSDSQSEKLACDEAGVTARLSI